MMTERQVRQFRDDLKATMREDCDCLDCADHRKDGSIVVGVLTWVLGEGENFDRIIETIAANAARARSGA